jgi:antitoxin CptB
LEHLQVLKSGSEAMLTRVTANAAIRSAPNDREALDGLRRKLEFRAWRRGTSEADLLIGTFADQCLAWFAAEELRQFERLLEQDDPVIDDWITGRQPVPKEHDNRVMNLLRRFHLAISDGSRSRVPARLTLRCSHLPLSRWARVEPAVAIGWLGRVGVQT